MRTSACSLFVGLLVISGLAAQAPGVRVQGVVVDENDKPVGGAVVSGVAVQKAGRYGSFNVLAPSTTNDKGEFTLTYPQPPAGLTLSLRARKDQAFTAAAVAVSGKELDKPVRLKVSPANARQVSVRVVDKDGKPIAGAAVSATHLPTVPKEWADAAKAEVKWPDKAPASDARGVVTSSRCLDPDGQYRLAVTADGFLGETTPWKAVGKDTTVAFGDLVLARLTPLEGDVIHTKGKPVAGARVTRDDHRQRTEGTTDAMGRFSVKTTFVAPGFLFASKDGFRFTGQRCDAATKVRLVLALRDEPSPTRMTTLPPVMPLEQRRAVAEKVLAPMLPRLAKADDGDRLRLLEKLAELDPAKALEELERRPFKDPWYDGYVRRGAVKALRADLAEAKAVAESIKDASFRATCYLDLHNALPAAKKAERLDCLNQALVASRAIEGNDHRLIQLGQIGRRLHELGEKDRAVKLLREGAAIAKELPTAGWGGYARGAFAEDLAVIDLPAALALMKDLKDEFEFRRHTGNLAQRLGGADPAEAERLLGLLAKPGDYQGTYQRDQYAVRVCHRVAAIDLPRARKIAKTITEVDFRARAYAMMALALAKSNPKEARELLDEAVRLLREKVAAKRDSFNRFWHAASLVGLCLPVAEAIDPGLVPEFFWQALWLHGPSGPDGHHQRTDRTGGALGSLALTLARYDPGLALALIDKVEVAPEQAYDAINLYRAAALAAPERAVAMLARLPDDKTTEAVRLAVVSLLLADGTDLDKLVHAALAQWHVDNEDL